MYLISYRRKVKSYYGTDSGNEQWKLNGSCEKCRKNNYCSKTCTRHDRRIRAEFKGLVADTMDKMTGGMMSEAIYKTVNGIW